MLYFARFGRVLGFIFEVEGAFGAILKLLVASWAPWAAVGRHRVAPTRPRSNFPNFFLPILIPIWVIFGSKNQ